MVCSALPALLFSIAWFPPEAIATEESINEDAKERSSVAYHHRHHERLRRLRKNSGADVHALFDHGSDVGAHTGENADRRPIITGCLKACGNEEQSCVTQCQVCMEQNGCRIGGDCELCLKEARAMRLRYARTDKTILDSGGIAMMRDGLMAEMTEARLKALDWKRTLRVARENVLKAQREEEYATQERQMKAKGLKDATQELKSSKHEVERWKLQNEKKLKAARARAREQRQQRKIAERKLEAAKLKHKEAERNFRIVSNASITNTSEDEEEVWRASRELEEQRQAVEEAETLVEKTSEDGEWLDRGLQRRVRNSQRGAKEAREELLIGRARERVSQESLGEAKDKYLEALAASNEADKVAEEMESKLRQAPLPEHSEALESDTGHGKDEPTRNGGSCLCTSLLIGLVAIVTRL
jgi:hypothetical protein